MWTQCIIAGLNLIYHKPGFFWVVSDGIVGRVSGVAIFLCCGKIMDCAIRDLAEISVHLYFTYLVFGRLVGFLVVSWS